MNAGQCTDPDAARDHQCETQGSFDTLFGYQDWTRGHINPVVDIPALDLKIFNNHTALTQVDIPDSDPDAFDAVPIPMRYILVRATTVENPAFGIKAGSTVD